MLVLLLVLFLRLATIGRTSLWLDEMMQVELVRIPDFWEMLRLLPRDKPPLDYLLLRALYHDGASDARMRIPAALAGAATIGVLFLLLLRLGMNRLTALAAAALLAAHPLHFSLSQELLPYATSTLWVSLFAFGLLLHIHDGSRKWLAVASVAGIFAILTAFTTLFSLAAISAGALAAIMTRSPKEHRWKPMLMLAIPAVVALAVYIPFHLRMQGMLEAEANWKFPSLAGALVVIGRAFFGELTGLVAALSLIEGALLVLGIITACMRRDLLGLVALIWLSVGTALQLAAFAWQDHWLEPRYFLSLVVPVTLLQALALDSLAFSRHGFRPALAGVLVLLLVAGRLYSVEQARAVKPDYRGKVAALAGAGPLDIVLVDHKITRFCYGFYASRLEGSFPEPLVFAPASSHQVGRVGLADAVSVFAVTFDGAPLPDGFTMLQGLAGEDHSLSPAEAIAAYSAPLQFPTIKPPVMISMNDESKPLFQNGWSDVVDIGIASVRRARSRAQIAFLVPEEDAGQRWSILFSMSAAGESQGTPVPVTLKLNGTQVGEFQIPARELGTGHVDTVFEPGLNLLVLEAQGATSTAGYVLALESLEIRAPQH
jgi:hypothetical protein